MNESAIRSMVGPEVREHIHRYFVAIHGKDYVYRPPEAFGNVLEQWMAYVAFGEPLMAESAIRRIEQMAAAAQMPHAPAVVDAEPLSGAGDGDASQTPEAAAGHTGGVRDTTGGQE